LRHIMAEANRAGAGFQGVHPPGVNSVKYSKKVS
jgi:hypothetical protein